MFDGSYYIYDILTSPCLSKFLLGLKITPIYWLKNRYFCLKNGTSKRSFGKKIHWFALWFYKSRQRDASATLSHLKLCKYVFFIFYFASIVYASQQGHVYVSCVEFDDLSGNLNHYKCIITTYNVHFCVQIYWLSILFNVQVTRTRYPHSWW